MNSCRPNGLIKQRCSRGHTLMELMVVCAVIGCLTWVGLNRMQEMIPAARVNRAVREVSALLEWTRWQAVRHGSIFKVVIDSEQEKISVFREFINDNGEADKEQIKSLNLKEKYQGVVFGATRGVKRTSGCNPIQASGIHFLGNTVKFRPTGTADRCGSLYLIPQKDVVLQRNDRMRAISVLLATARVAIWQFDPLKESECEDDGAWISF